MIDVAHILYWSALGTYATVTLIYASTLAFKRHWLPQSGTLFALAGWGLLTLSLALRWIDSGHGPYLGRYEAFGSYAWTLSGVYLAVVWRAPHLRGTCLLIAPTTFLLLGAGILSPSAPQFESPAMRSAWLWIHVGMAKIALASLIMGAGSAIVYLRTYRAALTPSTGGDGTAALSAPNWRALRLEEISVGFTSLGFLMLAVVIGAGALWANTAWGNYWSWDPIETWALGTWILYGILLHLSRLWNVSGARWAWLNIGVLSMSVMLFLVMRLLTLSPHWIYLG